MKIYSMIMLLIAMTFGMVMPAAAEEIAPEEPIAQTEAVQAKLNINTASAEEMAKGIKGIGKKKAQLIVEYREKYGAFATVDELTDVKGIGKGILSANAGLITVE